MTQQDLANKLSITNKAVSRWETGEGYPDISVLPALAEILDVTVDELLKGEKNDAGQRSDNTGCIGEVKQQAEYLLEKSKKQFSNRYLVCLSIILLGIIASSLSFKLYKGDFLASLSYTLIISLSFMAIGMMFYTNALNHLKQTIKKYNGIAGDEADYGRFIYKRHLLFYATYLIQGIICIVIPLYPFVSLGYYRVFHRLIGYNSFGRLTIDYYFCLILCFAAYCILFIAGAIIIRRKFGRRKS